MNGAISFAADANGHPVISKAKKGLAAQDPKDFKSREVDTPYLGRRESSPGGKKMGSKTKPAMEEKLTQ